MKEIKKILLSVIMLLFLMSVVESELIDNDANLEVKLSSSKTEYAKEDSVIIDIKFVNKGYEVINFIKPIEPYHLFFQIKIRKVVRDSLVNISNKYQTSILYTPNSQDGRITLNPSQTFSIELIINKNSRDFLGKEYFNDSGRYIISVEFVRKILIIPDTEEPTYTDKYSWQSNELEIEIK